MGRAKALRAEIGSRNLFKRVRPCLREHEPREVLPPRYAEFAKRIGQALLCAVHREAQVLGDLGVRPVARSEHADGELGGGEVVRHVIGRRGVMDASPAGGKAVRDFDHALEVVRPRGLDGGLEHTAQKSVVLTEGLDEAVRARDVPGGEDVLARLVGAAERHEAHDGRKMQVDGRYGVKGISHGKGAEHDTVALLVGAFEVEAVRLDVAGKEPKAGRQEGKRVGRVLQGFRCRQVQQRARGVPDESRHSRHLGRRNPPTLNSSCRGRCRARSGRR